MSDMQSDICVQSRCYVERYLRYLPRSCWTNAACTLELPNRLHAVGRLGRIRRDVGGLTVRPALPAMGFRQDTGSLTHRRRQVESFRRPATQK
jgi:hypothetical protein